MTTQNTSAAPRSLVQDGVAIVGIGVMGAAYAARVSSLGVPATLFNRTKAKAAEVAAKNKDVTVADSLEACIKARDTILVACSPTLEAIRALFDPLAEKRLLKGKHIVFIVDAGIKAAKYMDEILYQRGNAASVVNVAMFGSCYNVMQGAGAVMNASGRLSSKGALTESVQPLLELFGQVTYHEGGPGIAAMFAMAGHVAFLPLVYGQMQYQAMMRRSGVDSNVAMDYFKLVNRAVLEGYAPMLQSIFEKRDYSLFFFSHGLAKQILDGVTETCKELAVDAQLAALFADYHARATETPGLALKSFTSVYEVIDGNSK